MKSLMSLSTLGVALRSGHWPTLAGAWLHLTVSFMVWLLFGALAVAGRRGIANYRRLGL